MPRKVTKNNYYDHDDRTSGGRHNIRKVSFMHGSGRIRKNKRTDNLVVKYVADDDIEMSGSENAGRQPWKGGKPRKNFKRRPGSPDLRNSHLPKPLRPNNDWYQIKILYGAKYEKTYLLQLLLKQISPKVFIPNSYANSGKDVIFYVDDYDIAVSLRNISRKVRFLDGFLVEIKVREALPPPIYVDDKVKERLKHVMAKRYIAENKALDLSKFASDPDLKGDMYCPLSRTSIMRVVWQIISENISDLVAINLNNNKIVNMDDSTSVEIKKLKNLKILHLGSNRIKSVHTLNCFKGLELTELVLKDNPIVSAYKDNTHYVRYDLGVTGGGGPDERIHIPLVFSTVIFGRNFPNSQNCKLFKQDEIELPPVISFDVSEEAKLPPPQAAFICNPDGRGIVKAFLSQYFALYDSDNRLELAQAYHDNSSFSLTAYHPANQKNTGNTLINYLQESRNLFKVRDYPRRKNQLHTGKQNIVKFLSKLPKSQHDLSSFVVDLTLFTPALLNLSVNGVFREPSFGTQASVWPVRHFARTFLIVPVNQGFCIINEMLSVTNATSTEIQCSFKVENQNTAILQSPSSAANAVDVNLVTSAIQSVQLDDSVRLQMVQTLATRTGMNLEWSKKCLDETQWDFDRAIWTFTELQSKGTIPAEAFVK